MKASLSGPYGSWDLDVGECIIGRGEDCHIRVKDPRLSRHHACVRWTGEALYVHDLGSSNGTLVNGEPIREEIPLRNQDLLIIGPVACDVSIGEHSYSNIPVLPPQPAGPSAEDTATDEDEPVDTPADTDPDHEDPAADETTEEPGTPTLPDQTTDSKAGYTRQRTETMDPEIITSLFPQNLPVDDPDINNPTTKQALTSRQDSVAGSPRLDPAIKSAVDESKGDREAGSDEQGGQPQHTTDHLRPDRSASATGDSALQPNPDSPPPIARRVDGPRRITTEVRPHDELHFEDRAIETDRSRSKPALHRARVHLTGLRLLAGLLDGMQGLLLAGLLALPCLIAGYGFALIEAKAGLYNGLPHLQFLEPVATWPAILSSLLSSDGWEQAFAIVPELRERSQQAFLWFFLGLVGALLMMVLSLLILAIAPTTYHGAPFWHRRCKLVIVEHLNGYYPTPIRACLRWLAVLLLWPLAPFTLLFGLRSPHDLVCGCEVRHEELSK